MSQLSGQAAVVTGASRGVGLEIARALTDAGMQVALLARSEDALRVRAAELGTLAVPFPCDVANADAVQRVSERLMMEFDGPPDVIVNNAGLFTLATVERTDPREFREMIDVNLVAPFLLVHAFLGAMRTRKHGHIVTIGSIADRITFPENGAYAASKFGLRAFHEVLRAEVRGSGIRATLISPGPVDTALWDGIDFNARPEFAPRSQMLPPVAVAQAVLFALGQPAAVNVDELRLSRS